MVQEVSDYVAPPRTHHQQLVASLESDAGRILLRPNELGHGFKLTTDAEGFGPADVENEVTPRVGRRGAMLGEQREVEADMFLPIIIRSTTSAEVRRLVAEMSAVLKRADGTFRVMLTDPATGVTKYRDVAYREGLRTPVWSSPTTVKYSITADYMDPWAYSVGEESVTLSVAPGASGGLVVPVTFPIRFARSAQTTERFGTNTGGNPSPVTLRFNGPVTDPEAELIGQWKFKINGTLAWDEYLEVDPLNSTAYVYSTTGRSRRSAYNMISVGSRFTDLVMPPGTHPFAFRAIDTTYTATVTATWPHTFAGMI